VSDTGVDSAVAPALGEALRLAAARIEAAGGATPRLDAELLLASTLGIARTDLYTSFDRTLTAAEVDAFEALVARRARGEPVGYILGEWGFRRLTLCVDRRALIPRPETETVVERALARLRGLEAPRVLDVGTGSGAIALAIAHEHPGSRVVAIDASEQALSLARANVERTGLDIELRRHDFFTGLPAGPWQLVVSNPPYVEPEELRTLMPDVRDWEPHEALVAEGATEAIAEAARDVLAQDGALVLEVAAGKARAVVAVLKQLGYDDVLASPDLAGRDRVVEGTR
jgi:release factor glutamine methyltransferase